MFERGFKSWSENVATSLRNDLKLRNLDPLATKILAEYLEVRLWTHKEEY